MQDGFILKANPNNKKTVGKVTAFWGDTTILPVAQM
jgi:hypothetical protein